MNKFFVVGLVAVAICACMGTAEVFELEPVYSSAFSQESSVSSDSESSSKDKDDGPNAGMIVGIVVCCIVFVVIVGFAIYCSVSSASRHGKVEPLMDEGDADSVSMSVL